MILPIYIYGQPVLRKVAEDITPEYPELKTLIADMWETLFQSEGIGLAAPQIGRDIRLVVIAHSPALSVVSVNGSGDVMLRGPIRTESLTLHINGSGDVEAHDLTSQRVSVNINGSGDVQLAGKAREAHYDINGSGDIDCDQLHCLHVNAAINGSGDIECYASESINANINGSGDVDCIGNPKVERYHRR